MNFGKCCECGSNKDVIQTELTGYWSKHPRYYKVINHTYNNK